ncbi:DUF3800 domain-containing protein [Bradyrhizobium sp. OAE829]|uniref:DUF3800 domain-containing protein n=1 Tax=Bradyrhizobium sp. OAE829 TaxID=2663807 RepID=UPI00178AC667
MLQAYVDASGTGDPNAIVLAGFVAEADVWTAFSAEWKSRLDHAGLSAFKMTEMARSEASLEKAAYFYRTLEEFEIEAAISCAINTAGLVKVVNDLDLPVSAKEKLRNPYYLGIRALVEQVAHNQSSIHLSGPIDFIFDDQSEKREIIAMWHTLKFAAPSSMRPLLGDTPKFRDDKLVMPLQGADLYAWWVMKWHKEGSAPSAVRKRRFPWSIKKRMKYLHVEYDEDRLREGASGILDKAEILRMDAYFGRRGLIQEARGDLGRIDFEVTYYIASLDTEYYDVPDAEFDAETQEAAREQLASIKIFIRKSDGVKFNASEMLSFILQKSRKTLEDYVPRQEAAAALPAGKRSFALLFPAHFSRNTFHMKTQSGLLDLKQLKIGVNCAVCPIVREY